MATKSKAEGGEMVCSEYAAFVYRRMLGRNQDSHRSLLTAIRPLALYELIEVENGIWCRWIRSGKFVYEVRGTGARVNIEVLDSSRLKRTPGVDWRRVPKGKLDRWPL